MSNILLWIACFIAGYPFKKLKNYDGYSQRKIAVLAIGMTFPIGVYALDGWLIARNICQASVGQAILSSLIAAGFIFLLERAIVMTRVTRGLSAFRIVIAAGLSFIGAIGLMIDLFDRDVNHQVAIALKAQSKEYAKTVAEDHKDEMSGIEAKQKTLDSQYKSYATRAMNEPGGTHNTKPGNGPIAKVYFEQRELMDKKAQSLQAKRDSLDRAMAAEVKAEAKVQEQNVGLMTRVQALFTFCFASGLGILLFFTFMGVLLGLELMALGLKRGMHDSPFEIDEQAYIRLHAQRLQSNMNMTYPYHIAH